MRKLKLAILILTGVMGPLCAHADTLPAPTASYDADILSIIDGDKTNSTIKADGPKQRIVVDLKSGQETVFLERDTGKAYLLVPSMNTAMLIDGKMLGGYDLTTLSTYPVTAEGEEEIEGVETTRYAIDAAAKHGRFVGHVWSTDGGAILKIEGNVISGTTSKPLSITLWNFHERPQNPAFVSLPPGVKVVPFGLAALLGSQPQYPVPAH